MRRGMSSAERWPERTQCTATAGDGQARYSLTAAVFLLPFGNLADIHGRKRIYLLGTGAEGGVAGPAFCRRAPLSRLYGSLGQKETPNCHPRGF
jgi:MFS family permease